MKRVSPEEAQALMRDAHYLYLDVRTVEEFEAGHPHGAFNVPFRELTAVGMTENPRFLATIQRHFATDARLILGCQAGTRSAEAAEALIAAGFKEVIVQRAGMDGLRDSFGRSREPGWRASGLPVACDAEPGRSYAELAARIGAPSV